ncbi:MAG: dimethylsulfonioproprionate lyase family protein [Hyphomicrobiaceae bacterium]
MSRAAIRLLSSITDLYRTTIDEAGPGFQMLGDALHAIAACPYPREALRAPPPANRSVAPVAALVTGLDAGGPLGPIVEQFQAAEPFLDWHQDTELAEKTQDTGFLAGHGMIEIVGPDRLFRSATTRVGLMLLAPNVLYPEHAHVAEEVYHVISGTGAWWQQGEDWTPKPPGSTIHHPSGLAHATRTTSRPMLAVYCWRGPVEVAADEPDGAGRKKKTTAKKKAQQKVSTKAKAAPRKRAGPKP